MSKITVLTMISALFVFAFACTAFAEETEETKEPPLPVGGWAPAEAVSVPDDIVVVGNDDSNELQSSESKINADPNSVFAKGAARIGFDALDPAQQKLYKAIHQEVLEFMDEESDLKPTPVDVGNSVEDTYIFGVANYSGLGITDDQEALKAYYAYDYDHPALYWFSNQVVYNANNLYLCTEEEYASVNERERLNTLVEQSVKSYVNFAKQGADRLDQVALVHDKIVNDIDYAYQKDGKTPEDAKWAHGVHGVFDPHYKLAVCEGYADAFALILNYMEIPNYYIVGNAGTEGPGGGSGHAWNAFYDDAHQRYLYMDLTWDDLGEDGYSYEFFGMPMNDFEESHFEYVSDAKKGEDWLYDIAGTYNDDFLGTYYNRGGFYYDGSIDANALVADAKAKAARAGGWVSILCPDEDTIAEIAGALGIGTEHYTATYTGYTYRYLTAPAGGDHTHAWTDSVYTWAPDNSQVFALRICEAPNCDVIAEMETVNTTAKITKKATYTAKGQTTYSAEFVTPVFQAQSKTITDIPVLAKKANPMKVKATTKTVKVKNLKKKALTVAPLKVTSAKGKLKYKLVSGNAKSKKALKLNTKNGKVTVKKKTKKGTYKLKVKVTAAGTTAFKPLSKTVNITVKVR